MSSKIESKLIGTTLSTTATFKNSVGAIVAPSLVNLKYKKFGATTVTTVSVAPDVSNLYTTTVLLDVAGLWNFRWESIDGNSTATEFQISVVDTLVK